jgi:hypothetical protein
VSSQSTYGVTYRRKKATRRWHETVGSLLLPNRESYTTPYTSNYSIKYTLKYYVTLDPRKERPYPIKGILNFLDLE